MQAENAFKKLGMPPKAVPKDLKKKVLDDIEAFNLFMELASFFSSDYAKTLNNFLSKRKRNKY
jgi:ferritin